MPGFSKHPVIFHFIFLCNTSCKFLGQSPSPHDKCCLHVSGTVSWHMIRCCYSAVCVCVFIPFHLLVSSGCTMSLTYVRSSDQRSFVVSISWLRYAKFHHRRIWKCHISPPKTKTPAALLLERKRYDIMLREKMIYIVIRNKSVCTKLRSYEKILKIRRLL